MSACDPWLMMWKRSVVTMGFGYGKQVSQKLISLPITARARTKGAEVDVNLMRRMYTVRHKETRTARRE